MSTVAAAARELGKIAPEMLEQGEEFSYTYHGRPPVLVMVATGKTAQRLHPLAGALYEVATAKP